MKISVSLDGISVSDFNSAIARLTSEVARSIADAPSALPTRVNGPGDLPSQTSPPRDVADASPPRAALRPS